MDNHDPSGIFDAVATDQAADGLTRFVHKRLRESQSHPFTIHANLTRQGEFPGAFQHPAVATGQ